jgi:Ca-activated chloride channel family protein
MTTSGFANPWLLLLILPVLLLPFQRRATGRKALVIPRMAEVVGGRSLRTRLAWLPLALRMVGLALVVVALARPQRTRTDVMVESNGLDILLALDTSCSMQETDMGTSLRPLSRLDAAKAVSTAFVDKREHDRIGVVAFGEEAFTQCPLTLDHATLDDLIAMMQIGVAGPQGTAVGTALAVSAKRLKDLEAPSKIVVLVTDGRSNAGEITPIQAAQAAGALGIRVYTIGVGADRRSLLMPFGDGPDDQGLTAIAEATGGKYFRASSNGALEEIFSAIDQMEPSPAEVRQLVEHEERFRIPLIPGVFALLLDALLSATWLRRGP